MAGNEGQPSRHLAPKMCSHTVDSDNNRGNRSKDDISSWPNLYREPGLRSPVVSVICLHTTVALSLPQGPGSHRRQCASMASFYFIPSIDRPTSRSNLADFTKRNHNQEVTRMECFESTLRGRAWPLSIISQPLAFRCLCS